MVGLGRGVVKGRCYNGDHLDGSPNTVIMKIRKAVIPAAGLGTRFLPVTMSVPKELLPIVDRPLLQYVIAEASEAGIDEVIIVTSPGKESIKDYFTPQVSLEQRLTDSGAVDLLAKVAEVTNLPRVVLFCNKKPLALAMRC